MKDEKNNVDSDILDSEFIVLPPLIDILSGKYETAEMDDSSGQNSFLLPGANAFISFFQPDKLYKAFNSCYNLQYQIAEVNTYKKPTEAFDAAWHDIRDLAIYAGSVEGRERKRRVAKVMGWVTSAIIMANDKEKKDSTGKLSSLTGGEYLHITTNKIRPEVFLYLVDEVYNTIVEMRHYAVRTLRRVLSEQAYTLDLRSEMFDDIFISEIEEKEELLTLAIEALYRLREISVANETLTNNGLRLFLSKEDLEKFDKALKFLKRTRKSMEKIKDRILIEGSKKSKSLKLYEQKKKKKTCYKSKLKNVKNFIGTTSGETIIPNPRSNKRPIWSLKWFRGGGIADIQQKSKKKRIHKINKIISSFVLIIALILGSRVLVFPKEGTRHKIIQKPFSSSPRISQDNYSNDPNSSINENLTSSSDKKFIRVGDKILGMNSSEQLESNSKTKLKSKSTIYERGRKRLSKRQVQKLSNLPPLNQRSNHDDLDESSSARNSNS